MLSNAYFLAKFCFDTAENEPAKKLQNFVKILQNLPILPILPNLPNAQVRQHYRPYSLKPGGHERSKYLFDRVLRLASAGD